MANEPFVVTGIEETAAAFDSLARLAEDDIVPANQSAKLGADAAGRFAPILTGELASSYAVAERFIISTASYAGYVEYGANGVPARFPIHRGLAAVAGDINKVYTEWITSKAQEVGFGTG